MTAKLKVEESLIDALFMLSCVGVCCCINDCLFAAFLRRLTGTGMFILLHRKVTQFVL